MVKGRLDGKATTATGYAWFVWEKNLAGTSRLMWIPPCRKQLERPGDYDLPGFVGRLGASASVAVLNESS
jgi:hypothetical protein